MNLPQNLLNETNHRPWPPPSGKWKYYQEWNHALFLHWKVDRSEVAALLPAELQIDTYEGQAWVSVVAFRMERIRPRYLPSFPPVSNFPELNTRTYVTHRETGKTGVSFFEILAGNRLSCSVARMLSGLPYIYGSIQLKDNFVEASYFKTRFQTGLQLSDKTGLDLWLTERYALFQNHAKTGDLLKYEIHHPEWPLYSLEIHDFNISHPEYVFLNRPPDIFHYSPGTKILSWPAVNLSL